jgi:hypothetical protein
MCRWCVASSSRRRETFARLDEQVAVWADAPDQRLRRSVPRQPTSRAPKPGLPEPQKPEEKPVGEEKAVCLPEPVVLARQSGHIHDSEPIPQVRQTCPLGWARWIGFQGKARIST